MDDQVYRLPRQTHKNTRRSRLRAYKRAIGEFSSYHSFYLADSPGNLVGHLGVAARIASDTLIFFPGDTYHNCLGHDPGERSISEYVHQAIAAARVVPQD
ncbi:hypothetical protein PHLGIDRAFT_122944 [Phlebiopsis gigantea 11061_1 CR5-6]|uniref:Uncharacterized protein n=1 Tax=Phlebiopsis gigantea (strain 11061_1 CR5-6) TaxID=745531 RepID=A0A0C3PAQ0_PHLG1|nr:hypothetical protein PHLGIDRAFT_122944 [Phlebiopsis gigantea 11061_1 CR5-6]